MEFCSPPVRKGKVRRVGTQESAYPHGKVLQACPLSWAPRTPQGMWAGAGFGSRSSVPRGAFSTSGPIRAERLQKHSRWRVPAPVTPGPTPPNGLRAEMWVALSHRLSWSVESTQNSPLVNRFSPCSSISPQLGLDLCL